MKLKARVERLEARSGMHAATYAVYHPDTAEVTVCEADERLPLATFREHYPCGVIVKSLARELWEAL